MREDYHFLAVSHTMNKEFDKMNNTNPTSTCTNGCTRRVSNSCSTGGNCSVTLATIPMNEEMSGLLLGQTEHIGKDNYIRRS